MVDLSLRDQVVQDLRRTILHLIDIDAGIEQKSLSGIRLGADEWKFIVAAPCERVFRIEPRPTSRRVKVEFRHLRNRASTFGSTLPRDSLNASANCPQVRPSPMQTRSSPYPSRCPSGAWPADQGRAHPATDAAAFFAQKTRLFRRQHDRFKSCLAHDKPAGRKLTLKGLY